MHICSFIFKWNKVKAGVLFQNPQRVCWPWEHTPLPVSKGRNITRIRCQAAALWHLWYGLCWSPGTVVYSNERKDSSVVLRQSHYWSHRGPLWGVLLRTLTSVIKAGSSLPPKWHSGFYRVWMCPPVTKRKKKMIQGWGDVSQSETTPNVSTEL